MAENTAQTTPDSSDAPAPATEPATAPAPSSGPQPRAARRTVTVPVLPFAIVGSVLVALVFFGGGVAVGFAIGEHHPRVGVIHPFSNRSEPFGGMPGFGQNHRRDGGQPGGGQKGGGQNGGGQNSRPAPSPAPTNG